MKNRFWGTLMVAVLLVWCVAFSACVNNSKQETEAKTVAEDQFEPDSRFASIDSLADFMRSSLIEKASLEDYVAHFESQESAIKSYWYLTHGDGDQSQMTETVCNNLVSLADTLSGGSTVEMMQSGEIKCAVSRYLTAKEYCEKYQDNPLYQSEMREWIALEDELNGFYSDLSQLANWGGSIVNVIVSGSMSDLAKIRQEDYSQLHKDGQFAECELSISDARTELMHEIADANSLEENMDSEIENNEGFRETLKDMRERGEKVMQLLDKWLTTRDALSKSNDIPESHTAHLIEQLSRHIQLLIEG